MVRFYLCPAPKSAGLLDELPTHRVLGNIVGSRAEVNICYELELNSHSPSSDINRRVTERGSGSGEGRKSSSMSLVPSPSDGVEGEDT